MPSNSTCEQGRTVCAHHLITVLLPRGTRDAVQKRLQERGIGTTINYQAVHTTSFYSNLLGVTPCDYPVALDIGERTLSLPLWPSLPMSEVQEVVEALLEVLDEVETDNRKLSLPASLNKCNSGRLREDKGSAERKRDKGVFHLDIATMAYNLRPQSIDFRFHLLARSLVIHSDPSVRIHLHILCDPEACNLLQGFLFSSLATSPTPTTATTEYL